MDQVITVCATSISFRLSSLIFIYLNDLFFLSNYTEICNFADDTIFFARDKDLGSLINILVHDRFLSIEWF